MRRDKKKYKVLLLEPNYLNKYPPIGLMKIATYYRNLGNWDVVFYKGDLKLFVIEQISDKCISELYDIDSSVDWFLFRDVVFEYIRTRKKEYLDKIDISKSEYEILVLSKIKECKDYYWKGQWKIEPQWDRVCITTLFSFYWDITVETIIFAKHLVKNINNLYVGGILASIQTNELYNATGIKPYIGVLDKPGIFDKNDPQIIDNLPLDYSILDEIDYKYPMSNAYYSYTTRGCIRHCPFCAVPTIEPTYIPYIPLKTRINDVNKKYGEQKDLLLMDNNILASNKFKDIIQEIIDCGFYKGAKYTSYDMLEIAVRNLKDGVNDRAYIRKCHSLLIEFYNNLKNKEESYEVYKIITKYHVFKSRTCRKNEIISAYEEIKPIYVKYIKHSSKLRYVDFNQGVDARLFDKEKVDLLSSIAIRPLRIAFDDLKTLPAYENAIRMSAKAGIRDFSNYLLYNFKDTPVDLYRRLKINVELCEELDVSIYSFPMKYHPLKKNIEDEVDFSHNRDYIGKHWNRKYIRAIQAILNSTKGKVGRGKSFFYEAFGSTEEEFMELLEMPETFILYRFFFKWLDEHGKYGTSHWRDCWKECMSQLNENDKKKLLDVIHSNKFGDDVYGQFSNPKVKQLLSFYNNYRDDIITEGTELYKLKKIYDLNPTIKLKRHR